MPKIIPHEACMFAIMKREQRCEFLQKLFVQVPRWFVPSVSHLGKDCSCKVNIALPPEFMGLDC